MRIESFDQAQDRAGLRARKRGEPIVNGSTSYHAHTAALVDRHCDVILVGDSLGNVMHGFETTVPVTLDMMIVQGAGGDARLEAGAGRGRHAVRIVRSLDGAGVRTPRCGSTKERNAARWSPGWRPHGETIAFLSGRGIPSDGSCRRHAAIHQQRSFVPCARGDNEVDWSPIEDDAKAVADAGAFSVLVEAVAEPSARRITETIAIPTIGIGASARCAVRCSCSRTCWAVAAPSCPARRQSCPAIEPAKPKGTRPTCGHAPFPGPNTSTR